MKVVTKDIRFKEVPSEASLCLWVSECENNCNGCHTPDLKDSIGVELTENMLEDICIDEGKHSTCVCFMGCGGQYHNLSTMIDIVHGFGKKACLYTGAPSIPFDIVDKLDYYKVGGYESNCGGLDSITTNQRMYKRIDNKFKDITNLFQ